MFKMLILLMALTFLYAPGFAESLDTVWTFEYDYDGLNDKAVAMDVDISGNVYVACEAIESISGKTDIVVVKLLPSGDTAWIRSYNGAFDDYDKPNDICVGPSGNVFITGNASATDSSDLDIITIAYDPGGDTLWVRYYNGSGTGGNNAFDIMVDDNENIYVAGVADDASNSGDIVLIKYRPDGDTAWVRAYDNNNNPDYCNCIAIDLSGNIYVGGFNYGSGTGLDYLVIKYDSSGNEIWTGRHSSSGSHIDRITSIAVDEAGNCYATGAFNSADDYCTVKFNNLGDTVWTRVYDGAGGGEDFAVEIDVDGENNIYVTGQSDGTDGYKDAVTIKYDSDGNEEWVRIQSNYSYCEAHTLTVDDLDNIYISGRSSGIGAISVKYGPDGDTVWIREENQMFNGLSYDNIIDNNGYYYVTGRVENTDFDIMVAKYRQIGFPENDNWEDAIVLEGALPWEIEGTTIYSDSDCVGILSYPGVWYKFQPPYDLNKVSVHFCGTDPMPSLYGSNMFLDTVVCADYLAFDGWPTPPGMIECPGGEYVWDYTYKIPRGDTAWLAVMTGFGEDRQDFHLSLDIEQAAPDYNAYWEAASGALPDEVCPEWTLVNTADVEVPINNADTLIISTSDYSETMFYTQEGTILNVPDTLLIEFRMKRISGSTLDSMHQPVNISFTPAPDTGATINIGPDEIFILGGMDIVGDKALVDTDDDFHTYRIEAYEDGSVNVYYDNSLTLTGSTFYHTDWWDYQTIWWGKFAGNCYGESHWLHFRHNAYAFDTDFDGDGVYDSCDNCPEVYNPNQQDTDGDGTGDWCEGPIIVTNLDDSGEGSLRWAIDSANTDPALNYIEFDVSGTIALSTPLPDITGHQTNIEGSSAPGGSKSVVLDGTGLGDFAGLTLVSNFNSVRGLTLTNWDDRCIRISGSSNIVSGCHVNVNAAGDTRVAGLGHGISVSGNDNIIGGSVPISRNVIATPDAGVGIYVIGGSGNRINNNYVGLNSSGGLLPSPPAGFAYGIRVSNADSNFVGDTSSLPNYIADVSVAIELTGSGGNEIQNNILGLSVAKADTIGNNSGVVFTNGSKSNVFGPGNIIAGAISHGITLNPACDSNTIIGNTIAGNGGEGFMLTSGPMHNTIGGYNVGEGNIISDNFENGIYIFGNSDTNQIIGNTIGGEFGNPGSGNNRNGITIEMNCDLNLIDSNIIGYNGDDGITVEINSRRNTISRNRIFSSDELGIDLNDDGVTVNDPGDSDSGPNDLLNYPVIDSALMNPDSSFTVYGSAVHDGIVEFFLAHPGGNPSQAASPSGHGGAYEYIGTTVGDINGDFTFVIPNTYPFFSEITATATDSIGNTSEFSENFTLVPQPLTIVCNSSSGPKRECPSVVNIKVYDPVGDSIGYDADGNFGQSIFPAEYYETVEDCDDIVVIPYPLLGEYSIVVVPDPDNPPGEEPTYTIGVQLDGSTQYIVGEGQLMGGSSATHSYTVEEPIAGDANGDDTVNILDITFLIAYLYQEGPAPFPVEAGDANCDATINILDITYLITFLYQDGPAPGC